MLGPKRKVAGCVRAKKAGGYHDHSANTRASFPSLVPSFVVVVLWRLCALALVAPVHPRGAQPRGSCGLTGQAIDI